MDGARYDAALAGVGLANAMLALRLRAHRPDLRVAAFDAGPCFGAGRTWSFFATDLTEGERAWVAPFVGHSWPGYRVMFPGFERTLTTPYRTISASVIASALGAALGDDVAFGRPLETVAARHVTEPGGARIDAAAVVDGRGGTHLAGLVCGWQKFVGHEVRLASPHGLDLPILMDARVGQIDGYRFFYVLPLGPDRLLIEDTRYSLSPALEPEGFRREIDAYADSQGWRIVERLSEERGVLPVVMDGDIEMVLSAAGPDDAAAIGVRLAMFHPVTSYSLLAAVSTADALARDWPGDAAQLRATLHRSARRIWAAQGFYRLLNRMLFLAGPADQRWRVFNRFYHLPRPLIERFYAGRTTLTDRIRILSGRPPVPLLPALRCIRPGRALQTERLA
jgi:lycopene beta-cyclase